MGDGMSEANTEEVTATAIYSADQYGHKSTVTFIIDNYYVVTLDLITNKASWIYLQDAIAEDNIPVI